MHVIYTQGHPVSTSYIYLHIYTPKHAHAHVRTRINVFSLAHAWAVIRPSSR